MNVRRSINDIGKTQVFGGGLHMAVANLSSTTRSRKWMITISGCLVSGYGLK